MKKYLTPNKLFWIENDGLGNFNIGFTPDKLEALGEFITFILKIQKNDKILPGQQLFSIETTKMCKSFKSPVRGVVTYIAKSLEERPFDIHSKTILISMKDINVEILNEV